MQRHWLVSTALGLLASSCCLVQLIFNALSLGCAGFAILTPYKPLFLSLSALFVVYLMQKYGITRQVVCSLFLLFFLATSENAIKWVNEKQNVAATSRVLLLAHVPTSSRAQMQNYRFASDSSSAIEIRLFDMPTSGNLYMVALLASELFAQEMKQDLQVLAGYQELRTISIAKPENGTSMHIVLVHDIYCEACSMRVKQQVEGIAGVSQCQIYFVQKNVPTPAIVHTATTDWHVIQDTLEKESRKVELLHTY